MRSLILATALFAFVGPEAPIEAWMQQAFYPTLLLVLIVASLGVPIPEDVPLLAAGVLLHTHPEIGTWHGTIFIALLGIMSGDLVLYYIGKRWGADVVNHRSVRWLITPARFRKTSRRFRRYGMWFCFFGRFVMGVRAVMCITAGATRFRYWRFFLADFCGALITVPLWILLGYWFANKLPMLESYLTGIKGTIAIVVALGVVGLIIFYKVRSFRRSRRDEGEEDATPPDKIRTAEETIVAPPAPKTPASAPPCKQPAAAKL